MTTSNVNATSSFVVILNDREIDSGSLETIGTFSTLVEAEAFASERILAIIAEFQAEFGMDFLDNMFDEGIIEREYEDVRRLLVAGRHEEGRAMWNEIQTDQWFHIHGC